VASCWSHCPGAAAGSDTSWLRPDRRRPQAVGGARGTAAAARVSGQRAAGLALSPAEAARGGRAVGGRPGV